MPTVISELKPAIITLIVGIVLVFVGMTATTITGGVGQYVVKTLNDSVSGAISPEINMFKSNVINLMGTIFVFIGIAMLVAAVAFIIRALWTAVSEVGTTAATAT